ncbi:hypothetical protein KCU95_g3198, partial [Aureobasidium melanogenum]
MDEIAEQPQNDGSGEEVQTSQKLTKGKRKGRGKNTGQAKGKRQTKKTATTALREIEVSARHFWKQDMTEQLSQEVLDSRGMGKQRKLPGNELTVMALNEVAAEFGKGFFFHMLTREAWTSWPGEEFHPRSRIPELPGSRFPALLYINYTWTQESRQAFLSDTHRGRYLKSDIMINPPEPLVPLYAMQYVSSNNQSLYKTPTESLILLATDTSFYLVTTTEMERIGGGWPIGKRPPRGPEPEKRLNTVGYVWDRNKDTVRAAAMLPYQSLHLEDLYQRIVNRCNPLDLPSTFTAGDLPGLIPRPPAPEAGLPLGTMHEDQGFRSAHPASRRGEHRNSKKKARQSSDQDSAEEDAMIT